MIIFKTPWSHNFRICFTQDERGLRQLIDAGCYRSAINLTTRLLLQCQQGQQGNLTKHSLYTIQVIIQIKLDLTHLTNFININNHLYFCLIHVYVNGKTSPGKCIVTFFSCGPLDCPSSWSWSSFPTPKLKPRPLVTSIVRTSTSTSIRKSIMNGEDQWCLFNSGLKLLLN